MPERARLQEAPTGTQWKTHGAPASSQPKAGESYCWKLANCLRRLCTFAAMRLHKSCREPSKRSRNTSAARKRLSCGEIQRTGTRQRKSAREEELSENHWHNLWENISHPGIQYINKAIFPDKVNLAIAQGYRREETTAAEAREHYQWQSKL